MVKPISSGTAAQQNAVWDKMTPAQKLAYRKAMAARARKDAAKKAAASSAATRKTEANARAASRAATARKSDPGDAFTRPASKVRKPRPKPPEKAPPMKGTPVPIKAKVRIKAPAKPNRKAPTMKQSVDHVIAREKLEGKAITRKVAKAAVIRRAGKMAAGAKAKWNYAKAVKK
jgi:hypothetical protein